MSRSWLAKVRTWIAVLMLSGGTASFGEPQHQLLWPNGMPDGNGLQGPEVVRACIGNISMPALTVYRAPEEKATGAAVVVMPGGGYGMVCVEPEGVPIVR